MGVRLFVVTSCHPRHRCRGLIEAARVTPVLLGIWRVIRGIDAAASLKLQYHLVLFSPSTRVIRGIDAAASLKPATVAFFCTRFLASSAASMPRPH